MFSASPFPSWKTRKAQLTAPPFSRWWERVTTHPYATSAKPSSGKSARLNRALRSNSFTRRDTGCISASIPLLRARYVHSKGKNCSRSEFAAGTQYRRRKLRLVRRIGEVLCLEAETEPLAVNMTALSRNRAIQIVPSIELHTGFCRGDGEYAPCRWVINLCCTNQAFTRTI